jgi:hypothetical protein
MNYGDPLASKKCHGTIAERFWPKVDKRADNECWPWTAYKNAAGYGMLTIDRIVHPAHRISYELNVGGIPEGLSIDHVLSRGCTRKDCVNPAHLEPVTTGENISRAPLAPATINAAKTHCAHGHEFTPDNIYTSPTGGRRCRVCRQEQKRLRRLSGATG